MSDAAADKLEAQEVIQQDHHQEIIEDLAAIRAKASEVWNKIGMAQHTYHTCGFHCPGIVFILYFHCVMHISYATVGPTF